MTEETPTSTAQMLAESRNPKEAPKPETSQEKTEQEKPKQAEAEQPKKEEPKNWLDSLPEDARKEVLEAQRKARLADDLEKRNKKLYRNYNDCQTCGSRSMSKMATLMQRWPRAIRGDQGGY